MPGLVKILCCVGGLLANFPTKVPSFLIKPKISTSLPTLSLNKPTDMSVELFVLSTIPALTITLSLKNLNDALASFRDWMFISTKFRLREDNKLLN